MPKIDPELWVLAHGWDTEQWSWVYRWAAFQAFLRLLRDHLESPPYGADDSWVRWMRVILDEALGHEQTNESTSEMLGRLLKVFQEFDEGRIWCKLCGGPVTIGDVGIAHHIEDGQIDHEEDADHVAVPVAADLWATLGNEGQIAYIGMELSDSWRGGLAEWPREIEGGLIGAGPGDEIQDALTGQGYEKYLELLYSYIGRQLERDDACFVLSGPTGWPG